MVRTIIKHIFYILLSEKLLTPAQVLDVVKKAKKMESCEDKAWEQVATELAHNL